MEEKNGENLLIFSEFHKLTNSILSYISGRITWELAELLGFDLIAAIFRRRVIFARTTYKSN